MKVEIRKIGKGATELYINGVQFGKHIVAYEITQENIERPILTLKCTVDELGFECDDVVIKKDVLKIEKE